MTPLGRDYNIVTLLTDHDAVRNIKKSIMSTPTNRTKAEEIRGKALPEQITIGKGLDLPVLDISTQRKYLRYIKGLFKWVKSNMYLPSNPFEDIEIAAPKSKNKSRDEITKDEIKIVLNELEKYRDKKPSQYWGALIAIYTGARSGEVSALLPSDIKKDEVTGIWYFDIVDEKEQGKGLKNANANRIVPIHEDLIKRGLLDFVEVSKSYAVKKPKSGEFDTRLLYDFTHTDGNGWGRKLSQFVNDKVLEDTGIKTKAKVLHSFRHSFISNLSRAGVIPEYIRSMVGHEQGTVTASTYTHYGVNHLERFKESIQMLEY